jgi:hypothetical protein
MKKARDIFSRETFPLRSTYLEDLLGRLHLLHADWTLQQLPHPAPSAPSPLCDTIKKQCCESALVSIRIRNQHYRVNADPEPDPVQGSETRDFMTKN